MKAIITKWLPEWFKEVPWYEWYYAVNKLWEIYSMRKNRIMGYSKNNRWYVSILLCKHREHKRFLIHRVVMRSFSWDSELEVNHLDGNKLNNELSNLEYCDRSKNIRHSYDVLLQQWINKWKYWSENHLSHQCKSTISWITYWSLREMSRVTWYNLSKIRKHKVGVEDLITLISL